MLNVVYIYYRRHRHCVCEVCPSRGAHCLQLCVSGAAVRFLCGVLHRGGYLRVVITATLAAIYNFKLYIAARGSYHDVY